MSSRRLEGSSIPADKEALLGGMVETYQYHDNHHPVANLLGHRTNPCSMPQHTTGPPASGQPCARHDPKLVGTSADKPECGKEFPKGLVEVGSEQVSMDPRRKFLRYHGYRQGAESIGVRPNSILKLLFPANRICRISFAFTPLSSRNNIFINAHRPIRLLAAQANVDDSPITTLDALLIRLLQHGDASLPLL